MPDPARFALALQDCGLASLSHLASQSTFAWLEQELTGDGLPWDRIAACVLAARMDRAMALDHGRWRDFVARVAPSAVREPLQTLVPVLFSSDQGQTSELIELMAVHDGRRSALLCRLDDRRELEESHALRRAWNAYLRLFQWLRRAPAAWLVADSSTAHDEDYGRIVEVLAASEAAGWACLPEIEPSFQALAESLMEAGVEEPEIGVDVPDERGHVWAQAEMAWQSRRVALTCRDYTAGARGAAAAGWRMFDLQDVLADISPLLAALLPDRRPQPGPADPEEGS